MIVVPINIIRGILLGQWEDTMKTGTSMTVQGKLLLGMIVLNILEVLYMVVPNVSSSLAENTGLRSLNFQKAIEGMNN